jgi:hypothetical protein
MVRTTILCPECMKKKLLEHHDEIYCDECGTQFIKVGKNTVKYK